MSRIIGGGGLFRLFFVGTVKGFECDPNPHTLPNPPRKRSKRIALTVASDQTVFDRESGMRPALWQPTMVQSGTSTSLSAVVPSPHTIMASHSATSVPTWVAVCGNLAPAAAIVVFLAPWPTIANIRRDRTVGTLPLLPYSSMIASAFLWVVYGLLKNESKIWSSNGVGLVLGLYYFGNFVKHAPKAAPTLPGSVKQHLQAMGTVILGTLMLALSPMQSPVNIIGTLGVIFCVAMFASPLAALKTVLETKSAQSIPLPFTLASTANCLLWSITGIFDMKDPNVIVPNLLGLVFSLAQVVLKIVYGDGPKGKLEPLPL